MAAFTYVQRQAQQLVGAVDGFAIYDLGDAQVDLGEILDVDKVGDGLAAGRGHGFDGRFEQVVEHFGLDALHQVFEGCNAGWQLARSEERRVGKECGGTWRYRWWRDH